MLVIKRIFFSMRAEVAIVSHCLLQCEQFLFWWPIRVVHARRYDLSAILTIWWFDILRCRADQATPRISPSIRAGYISGRQSKRKLISNKHHPNDGTHTLISFYYTNTNLVRWKSFLIHFFKFFRHVTKRERWRRNTRSCLTTKAIIFRCFTLY